MTLVHGNIRLEPTDDTGYLVSLADKDNGHQYPREEIEKLVRDYGKEFWKVYIDDTLRGIACYLLIGDIYAIEALVDRSTAGTGLKNSVKIGKVIMDYLFTLTDKIRTCARVEDKAIQHLCDKLGFTQICMKDGLIIYEKEKIPCL